MEWRFDLFRGLAIVLFLVCLVLAGLALVDGAQVSLSSLLFTVNYSIMFMAFAGVGAFVAYHRLKNPIGWMFLVVALSNMVWIAAYNRLEWMIDTSQYPLPIPLVWAAGDAVSDIGWALMPTLVLVLFPDGRLPDRGWRVLAWVNALVYATALLINFISPGDAVPELLPYGYENPLALRALRPYAGWINNIFGIIPLITIINVIFIVRRYRQSVDEERMRYKWFALAGFVLMLLLIFGGMRNFVNIPFSEEIAYTIFPLGVSLLPIAVGMGILRYRLYNIDLIINRTLVYGLLTLALTVIYFITVSLLQVFVQAVSGTTSNLTIVISTLAIAALFSPLRRLLQGWIDRRFFRQRYDTAQVLNSFNTHLRDAVDVEIIAGELKSAVVEAIQPLEVSLWLRPLSSASEKQNPQQRGN